MDKIRTMITFRQPGVKFTYRISGIVIYGGQILFQRATVDPEAIFWFLPGGRAEFGESAEDTLKREMQEELGIDISIERLLYVVENFYEMGATAHHELGLYFLMTIPPDTYLTKEEGPYFREDEGDLPMIFDWLPLDQFAQLAIQPAFLKHALLDLPLQTTHIVQIGEKI